MTRMFMLPKLDLKSLHGTPRFISLVAFAKQRAAAASKSK